MILNQSHRAVGPKPVFTTGWDDGLEYSDFLAGHSTPSSFADISHEMSSD